MAAAAAARGRSRDDLTVDFLQSKTPNVLQIVRYRRVYWSQIEKMKGRYEAPGGDITKRVSWGTPVPDWHFVGCMRLKRGGKKALRVCAWYNHPKGEGCTAPRCEFEHVCSFCGGADHGAHFKVQEGTHATETYLQCPSHRKYLEEEAWLKEVYGVDLKVKGDFDFLGTRSTKNFEDLTAADLTRRIPIVCDLAKNLKLYGHRIREMKQQYMDNKLNWDWDESQEPIPEWHFVSVASRKQNGLDVCASFNHRSGYGCKARVSGECHKKHVCSFCFKEGHGAHFLAQDTAASVELKCPELARYEIEREWLRCVYDADPNLPDPGSNPSLPSRPSPILVKIYKALSARTSRSSPGRVPTGRAPARTDSSFGVLGSESEESDAGPEPEQLEQEADSNASGVVVPDKGSEEVPDRGSQEATDEEPHNGKVPAARAADAGPRRASLDDDKVAIPSQQAPSAGSKRRQKRNKNSDKKKQEGASPAASSAVGMLQEVGKTLEEAASVAEVLPWRGDSQAPEVVASVAKGARPAVAGATPDGPLGTAVPPPPPSRTKKQEGAVPAARGVEVVSPKISEMPDEVAIAAESLPSKDSSQASEVVASIANGAHPAVAGATPEGPPGAAVPPPPPSLKKKQEGAVPAARRVEVASPKISEMPDEAATAAEVLPSKGGSQAPEVAASNAQGTHPTVTGAAPEEPLDADVPPPPPPPERDEGAAPAAGGAEGPPPENGETTEEAASSADVAPMKFGGQVPEQVAGGAACAHWRDDGATPDEMLSASELLPPAPPHAPPPPPGPHSAPQKLGPQASGAADGITQYFDMADDARIQPIELAGRPAAAQPTAGGIPGSLLCADSSLQQIIANLREKLCEQESQRCGLLKQVGELRFIVEQREAQIREKDDDLEQKESQLRHALKQRDQARHERDHCLERLKQQAGFVAAAADDAVADTGSSVSHATSFGAQASTAVIPASSTTPDQYARINRVMASSYTDAKQRVKEADKHGVPMNNPMDPSAHYRNLASATDDPAAKEELLRKADDARKVAERRNDAQHNIFPSAHRGAEDAEHLDFNGSWVSVNGGLRIKEVQERDKPAETSCLEQLGVYVQLEGVSPCEFRDDLKGFGIQVQDTISNANGTTVAFCSLHDLDKFKSLFEEGTLSGYIKHWQPYKYWRRSRAPAASARPSDANEAVYFKNFFKYYFVDEGGIRELFQEFGDVRNVHVTDTWEGDGCAFKGFVEFEPGKDGAKKVLAATKEYTHARDGRQYRVIQAGARFIHVDKWKNQL